MRVTPRLAEFFGLTDDAWLRHANPLSCYTRVVILPLLAVAVWSRVWIGWWSAAAVAALLAWTYVNPLFFSEPDSTESWISSSVLGERVWTEYELEELPEHHRLPPRLLVGLSLAGLPPLAYGLYHYHVWAVLLGITVILLGKLWFLDRMVWLYEDVGRPYDE